MDAYARKPGEDKTRTFERTAFGYFNRFFCTDVLVRTQMISSLCPMHHGKTIVRTGYDKPGEAETVPHGRFEVKPSKLIIRSVR